MKIKEYKDGLAFCTEDEKDEIAFYSNITDRIRYTHKNMFAENVELSYKDNLMIMEEVRRYKRALESGVF